MDTYSAYSSFPTDGECGKKYLVNSYPAQRNEAARIA